MAAMSNKTGEEWQVVKKSIALDFGLLWMSHHVVMPLARLEFLACQSFDLNYSQVQKGHAQNRSPQGGLHHTFVALSKLIKLILVLHL
jgi:hypothetical protein